MTGGEFPEDLERDGEHDDVGDPRESMEYWETPEEHQQALLALQLPLRRKMVELLKDGMRSDGDLATALGLEESLVRYHLGVLAAAYLVDREGENNVLTPVGAAWLEKTITRRLQ